MLPSSPVLLIPPQSAAVAAAALDSSTTAWVNAVVAAGSSVSAPRRTIIDTFIKALKSASIWTSFDRINVMAGENATQANIDLVSLHDWTSGVTGSPTFTANQGYTGTSSGNSATIYIDTGLNPSTAGGNYTQNAAHISVWNLTNSTTGLSALTGADSSASQTNIFAFTDNKFYTRINDTFASAMGGTLAPGGVFTGLIHGNRSSSTARQMYSNGSSLATASVTSAALVNKTFLVLGNHGNNGTTDQTTGNGLQQAFWSCGGDISGSANAFYTAVQACLHSIGAV